MLATQIAEEAQERADGAAPEASVPLDRGLVRGLAWSGTAKWGGQLITWGSTLIIARLLAPQDYGIVGMALVFAGFLEILTDAGLGSAIVQARALSKEELRATMGATCLISVVAGLVVFAGAPLWAYWYEDPRLTGVVAAMGVGVLLTGVSSLPNAVLQRRLAFDLQAKAQLQQGLSTAVVSLGLAIVLQSYWALVLGLLVGKLVFTARVLLYEPISPSSPFRTPSIRPLLRYGMVLSGDRVLYYFRSNFDVAIIGAWLGGNALGLYLMAVTLARMPMDKLAAAVTPVAFPVFARAQGDTAAMRRHYTGLTVAIAAGLLPTAAGMMLTAPLLVPTLIGAQWAPAVPALQVIALFTPIVFLWSLNHSLLNALGRVDLNFRMTLAMTVLIPPSILIGARWGTVGVAMAGGLAYLPVACYGLAITWRMIELRPAELARALVPVVSATLGMTLAVLAVGAALPVAWPVVPRLVIEVLTGAVAFPAWAMLLHREAVLRQWGALRGAWSERHPDAPPGAAAAAA
jgi:teichuronic acid exporter